MIILTVIGARPQFIKAATVSRMLREHPSATELLLHTGQHYDPNMSEVFFRQLDIPEPAYNLGIGSGSHAYQTGSMLMGIEEVAGKEKPDCMLVYGDTNSTLAGALVAAKLHIPLAHVEAGLRSFNLRMPEEINRIVTDRIGNILFAPTKTAVKNLEKEGLKDVTLFSGDVMYDSVLHYREKLENESGEHRVPGIPDTYYLATVHRAENTDDPANLRSLFTAFSRMDATVVIPLHPRTRKMISDTVSVPGNVLLIEPVGYLEMLRLTMDAKKVLTDSGGLQKEAYFLGRPCITLRNETEWTETLHDNRNTVAGTDPGRILEAVHLPLPVNPVRNEFGDGHAAEIIVGRLLSV